ncbi:TPA: hypothetical protein ACUNCG_000528 [Aeromonas hydrophila]|uniref:hypothetical protein n=1 Tax=Aeromonas sp. QDB03 TaxID=2989839 RepID=UPI0022E8363D|nr:hypothetical protein [Aeromonas sp. QDB03]
MQVYMNTKYEADNQWVISSVKLKDNKVNTDTVKVANIKAVNKMLNGFGLQAATTAGKAFKRAIKNVCEFNFIDPDDSVYVDYNESMGRLTMVQLEYTNYNNTITHSVVTITKESRGVEVKTSNDSQFKNTSKEKKSMSIKTDMKKLELRGTGSLKRANTAAHKTIEAKIQHLEDVQNFNARKTEMMMEEILNRLNKKETNEGTIAKYDEIIAKAEAEKAKLIANNAESDLIIMDNVMSLGGDIKNTDNTLETMGL